MYYVIMLHFLTQILQNQKASLIEASDNTVKTIINILDFVLDFY